MFLKSPRFYILIFLIIVTCPLTCLTLFEWMLLNAADTDLKRNGFSESRFPQYFIAFTKEATRKHK